MKRTIPTAIEIQTDTPVAEASDADLVEDVVSAINVMLESYPWPVQVRVRDNIDVHEALQRLVVNADHARDKGAAIIIGGRRVSEPRDLTTIQAAAFDILKIVALSPKQ